MDDDYSSGSGGFLDFFSGLARTAGDAYEATVRKPGKPETKPTPAPPKTDWSKIAIIGGIVIGGIVVLGIVAKMFKS